MDKISSSLSIRRPVSALLLATVAGLSVYYAVSLPSDTDGVVKPAAPVVASTQEPSAQAVVSTGAAPQAGYVEPGSNRLLSVAGTPMPSTPLPQARPIPVKAREGEVVGFALDANGVARPMRAGDLHAVPNSPGTFATVDMWAEGGPAVVAPKRSDPVPPELAKRMAEDRPEGDGM